MEKLERVIFIAKSGTCREIMAMRIMQDLVLNQGIEVLARGLIVQFPEPINQKAEAVLISNGYPTEGLVSKQLEPEEITENTLILAMESVHRERALEMYEGIIKPEQIWVLSEFVGDELEILDPLGGSLQSYGLCYESIRASIKKLIKILNEGDK